MHEGRRYMNAEWDAEQQPVGGGPGPHQDEEEQSLMVIRPAMFRAHPMGYVGLLIVAIAGLVVTIAAAVRDGWPNWLVWVGLAMLLGMAVTWVVWWVTAVYATKLEITNKRTIFTKGVLSSNSSEVLHHHIRNIRIDQTFVDRIFAVGRVRFDTSAGGGQTTEIDMKDVPNPNDLKEFVDEYRDL
mgnify:CR=1 FL=1